MQHGNSQMLPVLEISGWEGYRAGHRFDMVIGSRSGKKRRKKKKQYESRTTGQVLSAFCWEVITPWGLALRNSSSQRTVEPSKCKATCRQTAVWGLRETRYS